jgi:hypothetical protein
VSAEGHTEPMTECRACPCPAPNERHMGVCECGHLVVIHGQPKPTSTEVVNGNGKWRVTYYLGEPVMTELWVEPGVRIVIGAQQFTSGCAVCNHPIVTFTPTNDELDVCDPCRDRIAAPRR